MTKFVLIITFLFVLISCSEDKSQNTNQKIEPTLFEKYLNLELTSNLTSIQFSEERLSKAQEISYEETLKILKEPNLANMLSELGGTLSFCEIWNKTMKETEETKKNEISTFIDEMDKETQLKCKLYKDLYDKILPRFIEISETNKINSFYYFNFSDPRQEEKNLEILGIFISKEECESHSNNFQEELNYYISNCKYFEGFN